MVIDMRKLNEYTGKYVYVTEIDTIFRSSDSIAYGVYKDDEGKYYTDAYDGSYSIAEFQGDFANDDEAISSIQKYIDSQED